MGIKMGLLSKAKKRSKDDMIAELEAKVHHQVEQLASAVVLDPILTDKIVKIAQERGTTVKNIINARLLSVVNAYERHRTLGLNDSMPYGQYRGMNVEDMIRADPRYVNYLVYNSDIFVLDEEATELLGSLS